MDFATAQLAEVLGWTQAQIEEAALTAYRRHKCIRPHRSGRKQPEWLYTIEDVRESEAGVAGWAQEQNEYAPCTVGCSNLYGKCLDGKWHHHTENAKWRRSDEDNKWNMLRGGAFRAHGDAALTKTTSGSSGPRIR